VINQLNGKWAARKGLYYSTYLKARELLCRLRSLGWQVDLLWIPRTQNEECDTLTKGALAKAGVMQETQPPSIPSGPSRLGTLGKPASVSAIKLGKMLKDLTNPSSN
jgi:hypothetical protein